ncbi:MAG: type II secretion system protein [Vulcanimicrobiota bacterium]
MRRQGLSLVEVLVAAGVMALLAVFTVQAYMVSVDARRHSDVNELAQRNAMLGIEHLARLLRGAHVNLAESDGLVTELEIDLPDINGEQLVVTTAGQPVFSQSVTVRVTNGHLLSIDSGGAERPLAAVGDGGIAFEIVAPGLLEVSLDTDFAGERQERGRYRVVRRFHLPNQ